MDKIPHEMIFFPERRDNPEEDICNQFISGVYLHGYLEELGNNDLVVADMITVDRLEELKDGKYGVTVVINDKLYDSTLFYWEHEYDFYDIKRVQKRGLICWNNDEEALADAQEKFEKRSFWL